MEISPSQYVERNYCMSSIRMCTIAFDPYPDHQRLRLLCEAAADGGYDVDIICPRKVQSDKLHDVFNGVHIYRVPIQRRGRVRSLPRTLIGWSLFFLLSAIMVTRLHLKRSYDVIHVHNLPDFLVLTALIPKLLGAKIILDVQDISPELMAVKAKKVVRPIGILAALIQERISTTFADYIVTVGRPFADVLRKRGIPEKKITILPNIVNPKIFPSALRALPDAEGRPFIVMYHGTVEERFGMETAVRGFALAYQKIANMRLDIQGRGDMLPYLKGLVVELGVDEHVRFTPSCPVGEVVNFVAHGDVGIIPYHCDGFADLALPTKSFEFAWMHRPMIASDMKGMRSVFRPESVAYCDASDPESFAEAIIDLYQHPEKRSAMVDNAAEDYLPYRWEIVAKRYQELLATLSGKQEVELATVEV